MTRVVRPDGSVMFACYSDDLHPCECNGRGKCVHCDRKSTPFHRVARCAFCRDDVAQRRRDERYLLAHPEASR